MLTVDDRCLLPLRRVAGVFVLALSLALGVVGCGPDRPETFPVKGQCFYQGKPAAGAVVFFHPIVGFKAVDPDKKVVPVERPAGRVEDDGTFKITTFGANDGAPVGQYRVGVIWMKSTGKGGDDAESLLPAELMNPATSGLPTVTVRPESNVLPAFQLGK